MNHETTVPHSPNAERSIIGTMLKEPTRIREAVEVLPDGSVFFDATNGAFWDAMLDLWRAKKPITEHTVVEKVMESVPALFDNDHLVALATLDERAQYRTVYANAAVDAVTVHRMAFRRRVIAETTAIRDMATKPLCKVPDLILSLTSTLRTLQRLEAGEVNSEHRGAQSAYDELAYAVKHRTLPGIRTGNEYFDSQTLGFRRGGLSVVVGGSGTGKTYFVWQLMDAIERTGTPTGMIQGEMSSAELVLRQVAGVDAVRRALRGENVDDAFNRIIAYMARIQKRSRTVSGKSMELDSVIANIAMLASDGAQFVSVDYAQQIYVPGLHGQDETRAIYTAMKECARQLNIHIMLLSQLTAATNREKSSYSINRHDAYGGTIVTAYADVIMAVVWPYGVKDNGQMEGVVYFELRQGMPDIDKLGQLDRLTACHIVKDRFGGSSPWVPWWTSDDGLVPAIREHYDVFKTALKEGFKVKRGKHVSKE